MNSLCNNANNLNATKLSQSFEQQSNGYIAADAKQKISLGSPLQLLSIFKGYIVKKYNQHVDRQAFNYLLTLDDSLLRDIGVTRADVNWASNMPVCEDAAANLEKIARRR